MARLQIDGAAGGGQIFRSALTLSVLAERAVQIENIRGGRPEPGLRPQHAAALQVLTELTNATVDGNEVGDESVTFDPQTSPSGSVSVDVGTAGSVPLLFETLIHLGPSLAAPIEVTATGGTDVRWSPSIEYLDIVKRPVLRNAGFVFSIECERSGYYPAGGGEATISVHPSTPSTVQVIDRGSLKRFVVVSKASDDLEHRAVAERQRDAVIESLPSTVPTETAIRYEPTVSTGSAVVLCATYTTGRGGFSALGARGKLAETVGSEVVDAFETFHRGTGAVDRHLADQLLVPLSVAGGAFTMPEMTDHVRTNARVIEAFGFDLDFDGNTVRSSGIG